MSPTNNLHMYTGRTLGEHLHVLRCAIWSDGCRSRWYSLPFVGSRQSIRRMPCQGQEHQPSEDERVENSAHRRFY